MKTLFSFFSIMAIAAFLLSCESELTSDYALPSQFESTTLVPSPESKGPAINKTGELECWEYPNWVLSDFPTYDFNQGPTCTSKLDDMIDAGFQLQWTYTEEILGYCWESNTGCARPTDYIPGTISVAIDGNGDFDGNAVFADILAVAKTLYRSWQIGQGPGPNGEIAFICNSASIINISLGCSNTPNSTVSVTFDLFLDGQVTYRCDVCEEPSNTGPGPIGCC